VIVTISREYGTGGRAITRALAERLGYRLVDDDLPAVVAARLGTSPDVVDGVEHKSVGFGARFLRSLTAAVPEAFGPIVAHDDLSDAALREIERSIREVAQAGDAIIVGRAAHRVLADRGDLVRVFLTAPLPWRVAHVAQSLGVGEGQARAEIARVDGARRAFARERYDALWGDPHQYDLTIDVASFGVDGTVAVVACAVEARG
jgi:cytidylate kinase